MSPNTRYGLRSLMIAGIPLMAIQPAFAQLIDPGNLGGQVCNGVVVNNGGTVAGTCRTATGHFVAFRKPPAPTAIVQLPTAAVDKPCRVMDMNNSDVISGNCEGNSGVWVPVRWQAASPPNAPQQLQPLLGNVTASAGAINQQGAIAGVSVDGGGKAHAVVWPGGQTAATSLPAPGLLELGPLGCAPVDINDNTSPGPVVTGVCTLASGLAVAVRWAPTGLLGAYVVTQLDPLSGGSNCVALDINASRQVTGTCENASGDASAVRWPDGGVTPQSIVSLPGTQSAAAAINANGLIAGNYVTADGFTHGFFWNPNNGTFNDLGTLGGSWSRAVDINGSNKIVGTSQTIDGRAHAFSWTQAGGIIDLGTLGGHTSAASDISDNGRVVGTSQIAAGQNRAFYTDP